MNARELIKQAQQICKHQWRHFGYSCHSEPNEQPGVTTLVMDKKLSACSECGAHKEGRKIRIMLPS